MISIDIALTTPKDIDFKFYKGINIYTLEASKRATLVRELLRYF